MATKAEKTHDQIAASAGALTDSAVRQTDSADRRTELAADRTVLAAERTYAAWMRTGLAALASGIGARALLEHLAPKWVGTTATAVLIAFAVFCFTAGVWRDFNPRIQPPRPDAQRIPGWLLIGFNGFLVFVSLIALIGVWTY